MSYGSHGQKLQLYHGAPGQAELIVPTLVRGELSATFRCVSEGHEKEIWLAESIAKEIHHNKVKASEIQQLCVKLRMSGHESWKVRASPV